MSQKSLIAAAILLLQGFVTSRGDARQRGPQPVRYARFQVGDQIAYGTVEGNTIRQLQGDLFGSREPTDKVYPLASVKLLVPVEPTQVFALAVNYKSHAPGEEIPEKFKIPQPFYKSLSCLIPTGEKIVLPSDAADVHYEAEMVIVIGREARKVAKDKALDYVLGVTCGNDVSERVWQKNDHQWWRAKGADTFGPVGPFIVSGLNYDDLLLTLRQNGEVKQQQRTSDLIHGVADIVSFISHYVTLRPGDLIFTGTPGKTGKLKPGDTVEVELQGVGTLVNPVVADSRD
jgi:2-keto-4-pentenoate hydratase/2-oxohepta-3-ene-1,7-dioic acid hydratase in catechol pathway